MMRSARFLAATVALAAAASAPAATAHPYGSWGWGGPGYGYGWMPQEQWIEPAPAHLEYGPISPEARDAWLADCHRILADSARGAPLPEHLRGNGEEPCFAIMRAYESGNWPAGPSSAPFGYVMAPVTMVSAPGDAKGPCVETVTEEYVPEKRRSRAIPPRAKRVPDKRVPMR